MSSLDRSLRRPHLLASALLSGALVACTTAPPPARSPLREQLATPDTPAVERATVACLDETGWTVDSVRTASDGTRVVTAFFERQSARIGVAVHNGHAGPSSGFGLEASAVQLRIHAPGATPRITGGVQLPSLWPFWDCMVHPPLDERASEPTDGGGPANE